MLQKLTPALPCAGPQTYTNQDSQGTLMSQTSGFPVSFDNKKEEVFSSYWDRVWRDQPDVPDALQKEWGPWSFRFMGSDRLKHLAQLLFARDDAPLHVRVVYYFNVSTGYDCPRVDAIFAKAE